MKRYRLTTMMLLGLLLTACSKSETTEEKEPSLLSIYVYLPDRPVMTKAGEVNPISNTIDEAAINNLQIWVFNSETGELIAYHHDVPAANIREVTYHLGMSDAFNAADDNDKPNVDVYVLANNTVFNENTDRTALNAAVLEDASGEGTAPHGTYGLATLITQVPEGGLPMACVLHDTPVTGSAPVYKVPTMKLTRTVSKVRFLFSREMSEIALRINSIKLDVGMIPDQEYLFLADDGKPYRIGTNYNIGVTEFLSDTDPVKTDIRQNENPLAYAYLDGMDPQDYEDKIAEALTAETPQLSQVGPFYLRESDKLVTGIIKYQPGDGDERTAIFKMAIAGEFSRNHTWTIYAYYGGSSLELITVMVKDWDDTPEDHPVYNW